MSIFKVMPAMGGYAVEDRHIYVLALPGQSKNGHRFTTSMYAKCDAEGLVEDCYVFLGVRLKLDELGVPISG
jgi:hypothetical protein